MTTFRLASLPIDHLIAEMAAFPLASEGAFHQRATRLHPCMEKGTGKLWRCAERELAGAFPAFSVDELVATRDLLWFANGPRETVPLGHYLRDLANRLLERRGADARPRDPDGSFPTGQGRPGSPRTRARRTWRWLSFALPPDLLLAAMGEGQHGIPRTVHLMAPDLERCLADGGFVEPHLHIGASMQFGTLWAGALWQLSRANLTSSAFESPGACFDEGRYLGPWLVRAALCRYVLGCFLSTDPTHENGLDLAHYLSITVRERTIAVAGPTAAALLAQVMADLDRAQLAPEATFADIQGLYRQLTQLRTCPFPEDLDHVQSADPLAPLFCPGHEGLPTPEMQFVARGLAYLDARANDSCFSHLFWQIVRLRAVFYRHIVQRPMTPGLQWFVRFYARLAPAKRPFRPSLLVQAAARSCGLGCGLRSLELRTTPEPQQSDMLGLVKALSKKTNAKNTNAKKTNATMPELEVGRTPPGKGQGGWWSNGSQPGLLDQQQRRSIGLTHQSHRLSVRNLLRVKATRSAVPVLVAGPFPGGASGRPRHRHLHG